MKIETKYVCMTVLNYSAFFDYFEYNSHLSHITKVLKLINLCYTMLIFRFKPILRLSSDEKRSKISLPN